MAYRSIAKLALLLVSLHTVASQEIKCPQKPTEIELTVRGVRNATGHWSKDVSMDFDGPNSPEQWFIDFKERVNTKEMYSFTASAKIEGLILENSRVKQLLKYVYRGDIRNFTDASATCEELGAHLAIINNEQEAAYLGRLSKISKSPTFRTNYAFVGFSYDFNTNDWMTVEGKSLEATGFAKWDLGQPSNSSFILPNGTRAYENCGSVGLDGLLNDSPCETRLPFICEFLDEEDPCQITI
ncbi:hemolymph lipopolysaccharide-binding protein-like [Neocloeon triangulifer]|uniref:hemolymph lipopolysaccharide-binding protein-like n=1 Tax=Neocloeon triangulifer TaxID=2078957 RepID=UPI00286F52BF|nr:hemolymph lipopolysaccharide-binding protein-like [Neocloeon triangulifer]